EPALLRRSERATFAWSQVTELDRTVLHARESLHLATHLFDPTPHDSIAALSQRDIQEAMSVAPGLGRGPYRDDRATINKHALPGARCQRLVFQSFDEPDVAARHLPARMRQPMHRIAVGGEQQQSGGTRVEPAHIGETARVGHQVEHGSATLLVR